MIVTADATVPPLAVPMPTRPVTKYPTSTDDAAPTPSAARSARAPARFPGTKS
jgi:hypothetical protein